MGAFKPLLPFGDSTVIESCITNFRAAGIEEVVIVLGHRADDVRRQLENYQITFVLNPDPDTEMSVSIALGISHVRADAKALLITPVDHPAVPPKIIKSIVEEWRRTGATLIQPEHETRGGHPVLIDLLYRHELVNLDPETGLRSVFDRHREQVRRLRVASPFVARDMDTWEDYLDLHLAVFGRKPEQTRRSNPEMVATNGKPPGHI